MVLTLDSLGVYLLVFAVLSLKLKQRWYLGEACERTHLRMTLMRRD